MGKLIESLEDCMRHVNYARCEIAYRIGVNKNPELKDIRQKQLYHIRKLKKYIALEIAYLREVK